MIETKVIEMIENLAAKLGVASEKIWEWALLQVKVNIIQTFVVILLALVVTYIFIKILYNAKQQIKENRDDWDDWIFDSLPRAFGMLVLSCVWLILIVASAIDLYSLPELIINPEYAAFKNIVGQLSNVK